MSQADVNPATQRPIVVLLGGPSGAGKTQLSYRLARQLDAALVEVDDLVVGIQALTDADSHPALHYWSQHDSNSLTPDEVVAGQIRFAQALQPALAAVIANHVETDTRVVIEGDYIVPGTSDHPAVRTALVIEDDLEQLVANYRSREPGSGEQRDRAWASRAYGRWLADQARAHSAPVVAARPWPTAFDRLLAALTLDGER